MGEQEPAWQPEAQASEALGPEMGLLGQLDPAAETSPEDPERWRAAAERHNGSWWEDWAAWAGPRAGALTGPPPMGWQRYPAPSPAPGSYVRG